MFDRISTPLKQVKADTISDSTAPRMTLTVDEMAHELNISRATAYELVQQSGFPAVHIGHRIVIHRAGLNTWMESQYKSNPVT